MVTIDSDRGRFSESAGDNVVTAARVVGRVREAQLLDDEVGFAGDDKVAMNTDVNWLTVLQPEHLGHVVHNTDWTSVHE